MEKTEHVFGGLTEIGLTREGGKGDCLWEKIHLEDVSLGESVREKTFVAPVMLEGRSNVPTDLTVCTERSPGVGREVGNDFGASRGKRSAVEVKIAEKGGMG